MVDILLQKEETNSSGMAIAELAVDGTVFGTFSAISLLQIENQLKVVRGIYQMIPTLDPVKKWEYSSQKGIYETAIETSYRSQHVSEVIVLHGPTKEHPAQVKLIEVPKQVGKWEKMFQSGRITPKQKSELLGNIDKFINAVKKARSIANNAEVKDIRVAKRIIDFINKPLEVKK